MALYRRGKTWWFNFTLAGQRLQRSTKTRNRRDAADIERAERTRLARIKAGLESPEPLPKRKDLTIGDLLDALQADYKLRGKASVGNLSTLAGARRAFGTVPALALTAAQVDRYIEKRLADGARPATVNRTTQLVSQAYRLATAQGNLERAPAVRQLSERGNARQGFFSEREFRAVLENLPADLQDFTLFGYLTGWRKSEIASLLWADVEQDVIRLRGENSKNREGRAIVVDGELAELMARRRQARLTGSGVLAATVFHRDGAPVREFRRSWATACRLAGVERLFHDLRRTAVRNMVRAGVPERVTMAISGHKTRSIFDRYNITSEGDLRDAILRLQRYHEVAREKIAPMAVH